MRTVLTKSDVENMRRRYGDLPKVEANDPLTQVARSIPAEVLGFYLPAIGAISLATGVDAVTVANAYWIIFALGILGTIGYSVAKAWKEGVPGITLKTSVQAGAFIVWSLNLGGYTNYLGWFNQLYGTLSLAVYSLFTPLIFMIYDAVTKPPGEGSQK
ncbi:hypothetical protein GTO27_08790 [Candidatus Bathyarchaeota archaeon]|nr:hypothetical protein [Candidatus Bathyarchaeota archaeon]